MCSAPSPFLRARTRQLGFADNDTSTVYRRAVQLPDRFASIIFSRHFNKSKPLGLTGERIKDNLCGKAFPGFGKLLYKVFLGCTV